MYSPARLLIYASPVTQQPTTSLRRSSRRSHHRFATRGSSATASAAMDPRLQPQPDVDRIWADEIRYLHSLWRRGPPPNRNRNPRLSSGPDLLHATPVAFKRDSQRKEGMPTEQAASPRRPDEAGTSDPPLVDAWAKLASLTAPNPNPPTAWADVAPPPVVERPPVSAEEQARLAAAQLHHDGLKASRDFFSKIDESDDEEEAHEEGEEEEGEDDKEEKDGRQLEAFKFFMGLYEKDDELTEYYKKNHDKGEFSCFACAATGTKRVRKFGNCLGLVQHANSISKTRRRGAHRALARAVCQVLGWDTIRSAGVVLDLGDTGGQSSAGAAKTQSKDVIENEEHLPEDITQNTKANDGNITENLPEMASPPLQE